MNNHAEIKKVRILSSLRIVLCFLVLIFFCGAKIYATQNYIVMSDLYTPNLFSEFISDSIEIKNNKQQTEILSDSLTSTVRSSDNFGTNADTTIYSSDYYDTTTLVKKKIDDRKKVDKPHSVTRAVVSSALLPGLGQIYNKKAWKIPIIYVGFGVSIYFIISNNTQFKKYRDAVDIVNSGDQNAIAANPLSSKYSLDQLINVKAYYRKNMEIACIALGVIYILNIIDATVDAYMFNYDISENLSLKIAPKTFFNPTVSSNSFANLGLGLGITLKIR